MACRKNTFYLWQAKVLSNGALHPLEKVSDSGQQKSDSPSVQNKGGALYFLNTHEKSDSSLQRYYLWSAEKAMTPHSSTLAWKIPWTEEPRRLQSMGSWRVGHDWATSLSLLTFMHWRRKWQPTSVFLPGESQGRGSLVGCRLWGRTESDTT